MLVKCNQSASNLRGASVVDGQLSGCDLRGSELSDIRLGRRPTRRGHTDELKCLALSADGSRLFSGPYDSTIREWDMSCRSECVRVLPGHTSWVHSLALSADGQRLFSSSQPGEHRSASGIWRVASASACCRDTQLQSAAWQ